ncbi:hypothetical protein [Longispora albida]|uniref:hypothetical protein n=1 Tax=Longispora albida TaxID=203523 RepID=UPI00038255FF|nr:hypothetical protein [Longispora albida]
MRRSARSNLDTTVSQHVREYTECSYVVYGHQNRVTVDVGQVTLFLPASELAELIDVLGEVQAELALAVVPPDGS